MRKYLIILPILSVSLIIAQEEEDINMDDLWDTTVWEEIEEINEVEGEVEQVVTVAGVRGAEAGISYSVKLLDSSQNDPDWNQLDSLQVSLIKAFAYSGPDSILALGEGETYVWVVDSRFTTQPNDFTLRVGIERFYFDISGAGSDLLFTLIQEIGRAHV